MKTGNNVVDAIHQMNLEGNIIPHSWYQAEALRLPPDKKEAAKGAPGKPNTVAIILLSDIIYWYRPKMDRSENSGFITGARPKFAGDKLQKDYQAWADQFGFTKRQVQDAINFLHKRGLIIREFRPLERKPSGFVVYNAIYIEPIPEAIRAITYEIDFAAPVSRLNVTGITSEREASDVQTQEAEPLNVKAPAVKRESCTKTLPQNKRKETSSHSAPQSNGNSNGNNSDATHRLAMKIYESLPPGELKGLKYQPHEPEFAQWMVTHYHREARQLR